MKTMAKYWYLVALVLIALVINEDVVACALAVRFGGQAVAAGFEDVPLHFRIVNYLFFTALRLVPYVCLGITLVILSRTTLKDYILPVFIGGLIGILGMVLWVSWMALRPYYTGEHGETTESVLLLLYIPFLAVPTGAIGAGVLAAVYSAIRYTRRRQRQNQSLQTDG